jgi:hypothetical protein
MLLIVVVLFFGSAADQTESLMHARQVLYHELDHEPNVVNPGNG